MQSSHAGHGDSKFSWKAARNEPCRIRPTTRGRPTKPASPERRSASLD